MMEMISHFLLTFLLNAVWQITVIVLIAYFCQWLLRQTSASIQHLLWVVTLILSIGIPIFTSLDFVSFNQSLSQNLTVQTLPKTELQTITFNDSGNLQFETQPAETKSFFSINKNVTFALFAFYFLFIGYRFVKLFWAWRKTQLIRKKVFLIDHSEKVLSILEECRKVFNLEKAHIYYSSGINLPFTLGVFNPLIILPEQFVKETDRDILVSAIGHELVHIKRRDYLLNLLYEFIYLPLSFHPATMLMKRRIKETRELRCDELVTDKLLSPKIYAQSLVKLASSAIDFGRHTTITIGIGDADILEKRIMKILKKSNLSVQQRNILLFATSFLFVVAFAVAISFTIRPVIAQQESKTDKTKAEKQKIEEEQILLKKIEEERMLGKLKREAETKYDVTLTQQSPEERLARQKAELEAMNKLAKLAKVSMAQAIEIATKEVQGTILECKLVIYSVKGKDPNSKESSQLFYSVRIATDQEEKHLLVNAIDGKVSTPTFTTVRDKN